MLLNKQTFQTIIENAPLISIDLIVKNHQGQVLLGKRTNPPAQSFWFVPGGRIRKNEHFTDAFSRLTLQELGQSISLENANFLASYQHFYPDSIFGEHISTHYVVLAYQLDIGELELDFPLEQHSHYQWLHIEDLLTHKQVHQYTKDYFIQKR